MVTPTRQVTVEDIDDLAVGASVLGSGGGGDGYLPRQMLRHALDRFGPVPLVDAGELDPTDPVFPVIYVGTPTALVETFLGDREGALLRALVEAALPPGAGRCRAVLPVQPGAVNAMVPLVVAAQLGLPCLDAELMMRCFPMVEMTLFALGGIRPSPLIVVDAQGSSAVLDAPDDATVSALLRSCMPHLGLVGLASMFRATAADCARLVDGGGLTRCLRIGQALRAASMRPSGLARFGAVELFTGVVVELLHRGTAGFPRGVLSLRAEDEPSRLMRIDFQNENLVAARDGVVAVTVPDLIVLIDADTGDVPQTVDVVPGQRVHVVGMPVGQRWHTAAGLALVGPRAFGLDVDPVSVAAG